MKKRLHGFSAGTWVTPGILLLLSLPAGAQSPALTNSTPTTPSVAQEAVSHDPRGPYAEALKQLRQEWINLAKEKDTAEKEVHMLKSLAPLAVPMAAADEKKMEAELLPPERESLARNAKASFIEPTELRSKNGVLTATITAAYAHNKIGSDPVFLRNYDGKLVGPTIRVKPGDKLKLTVRNEMPTEATPVGLMNQLNSFNTTNMHYHGLHVSPYGNSDNVLLTIEPKGSQFYEVDIPKDHPAGTYWYHAHHHGSTAGNVASGMSGALIIEGGLDDIPEIKAAKDRTFVLNQIPYIYKNKFTDPPAEFDLPEGRVELEYAQYIFGPGDWAELGRFTTVNGIQLPVLRMRPGAMERWRFVASGQRELIKLKLMRTPGTKVELPEILPLNEIATDGLALGKVYTQDTIDLWPGYRSDVLIQAPLEPGEYLLLDEQTPADKSMNGIPESRKYIARLIIEGKPLAKPMPLPTDASMAGLRLPSIKASEVTGPPQEAVYGIIKQGSGIAFTIDRKSFNMDSARQLTLGKVDEWHLTSKNEVGPVSHPYHIHVNPFEVISMKDDKGVEQLKEPVWRDTIILNEGWEVRMRTRYEDFTGVFVQHCHILDHEDQGMMQLVEIVDPSPPAPPAANAAPVNKKDVKAGASVTPAPAAMKKGLSLGAPAPAFTLPDGSGNARKLSDFAGKPTALFFFKGHACLHCSLQVAAYLKQAEKFRKKGIQIVGITTDTVADLGKALEAVPCPFPILADPDHQIFHQYACYGDGILHGTFLLDAAGKVQWQTIGKTPYMDIDTLLGNPAEVRSQTASVDLNSSSASVSKPVASAVILSEAQIGTAAEPEAIEAGGADTAIVEAEAVNAASSEAPTAPAALPKIEVEIRNTSVTSDDYINWAPTSARIRQVPPAAGAGALSVVLGNDAEQPVPAGRKLPLDGNLAFAATVEPGQTATAPALSLSLPANGDWVPFIVAGAYPRASSADKDAVIEVRRNDAEKTLLGTQALMVRIRKDHRLLTATEKKRFLSALAHLQYDIIDADGISRYMHYVYMHRTAAIGIRFNTAYQPPDLKYYWPDLAHKGPGFIAWHRAFLLQFERDLQKDFPDVALPYWIMPEPAVLFQPDFIGENVISSATWVNPTFAPDNPIYGWTAKIPEDDGPNVNGLIRRSPVNRDPAKPNFPFFYTDDILFNKLPNKTLYSLFPNATVATQGFIDVVEQNPHNVGHNWVGEWMQDCATSPRDPVFWVFHTGFDRQWAHWQYLNTRFDRSGAGDSFCPLGTYDKPQPPCSGPTKPGDCNLQGTNTCVPVNHHVDDILWPWGGQSGQTETLHGNYPQADLAAPFIYPFPAAPIPGVWPKTDAKPTCGDMIDYAGVTGGLEMGFGYDDTPYGKPPAPAPSPAVKPADVTLFANTAKPVPERLAAASRLRSAMPDTAENVDAVTKVLQGTKQNEALRIEALNLLRGSSEDWMDDASELLSSTEKSTPALAVEAIKVLSTALMQSGLDPAEHEEVVKTLEKSLTDPRAPVRLEALRALAPMGHSKAVLPALTNSLTAVGKGAFTPAQAIQGLMSAGAADEQAALIRPQLDSPDAETRSAAVSALTGDVASRAAIQKILADRTQPDSVRLPAIQALLTGGADYFDGVLALAADPQESDGLRAEAVATLRASLRMLKEVQLQQVVDRLGALPSMGPSTLESVIAQTVRNATQRLKQKP